MKGSVAAAAAALAAGAYAQAPVSYSTVTIDDCPSSSYESMITVTDGVTVTYCPECESSGSGILLPQPTATGPGYTTTYTTTYMSYCSSGGTLAPVTFTITESCTDDMPTFTPGPSHIPPGFTTSVVTCEHCAETPTEVTITEPCGCEATSGQMVMPTPGPGGPGGPGSPPGPGAGPSGPGGPPATTTTEECTECEGMPTPGPGGPPGSPSGPGGPPGTTATEDCTECEGSSMPATTPATTEECTDCPMPTGSLVTQISDGQPQAPAGSGKGSAPPYPTAVTSVEVCTAPPCRASASSPTTPEQFTGAAIAVQARFGALTYSAIGLFIGAMALAL